MCNYATQKVKFKSKYNKNIAMSLKKDNSLKSMLTLIKQDIKNKKLNTSINKTE